jgi:predicted Kef-type K+ transport protein
MSIAIWVGAAFVAGLFARQVGLPPLVGFLVAVHALSEIGVILLLFTVGLKLRLKTVLRPEVWGTGLAHLALTGLVVGALLLGVAGFDKADIALVAAAIAFSSTVMAAKMLESRRELRAFHGRVAIGVLIIQDLLAVGVLAAQGSHAVSPATLLALGVVLLRPVFLRLLDWIGHGELLVLYGVVLALGVGGLGFESLGLSPELGALVLGSLLADHPKAKELGDVLWGIKEFLLVGFFLSIGLTALPTLQELALSLLLLIGLPLKGALFFVLLLAFGLRARTAFLAALSLASYSEFGLIVIAEAVAAGTLDDRWLVVAALTVSLSFALAAPLNRLSHARGGCHRRHGPYWHGRL